MLNEFEKIYIKIILFIIIFYLRPIFPQIFKNQTYGLGCIVIIKRLRDVEPKGQWVSFRKRCASRDWGEVEVGEVIDQIKKRIQVWNKQYG